MNRTQTRVTIDIKKSITAARGSIQENPWMTDNMIIKKEELSESEGKRKNPHTKFLKYIKRKCLK